MKPNNNPLDVRYHFGNCEWYLNVFSTVFDRANYRKVDPSMAIISFLRNNGSQLTQNSSLEYVMIQIENILDFTDTWH